MLEKNTFPGEIRQNTYNKNLGEEAKGPTMQSQTCRALCGGAVGPPCRR